MSVIANLAIRLALDAKDVAMKAHAVQHTMHMLGAEVEHTDEKMNSLSSTAVKTAAALVGVSSAAGAFGMGTKLAADAEQTEIAFGVMLKSTQRAKEMLQDLRDVESPFEFPEMRSATQNLIAFGFESHNVIPTLRAVGDVASGARTDLSDLADIYGQAKLQGRLFSNDINQLTSRGIPIIAELAKQFKVTESEIAGMVESGQVNFSHLERAFQSMSGEGGVFEHKMARQAESLKGSYVALKNEIGNVLQSFAAAFHKAADTAGTVRSIADSVKGLQKVGELAGTVLGTVVKWLTRVIQFFGQWKTLIAAVVIVAGAFVLTLKALYAIHSLLVTVGLIWWGLNTVAAWFGTTAGAVAHSVAMGGLSLAYAIAAKVAAVFWSLMGPVGWAVLAGAVVVAGAAIYGVKKALDGAGAAGEGFTDFVDSANAFDAAALKDYNREMQTLKQRLDEGAISQQQYDFAHRAASAVLHEKTRIAETARNKEEAAQRQAEKQADLQARAKEVLDSLNPALRKYEEQVAELKELLNEGAISQDTYNAALRKAKDEFSNETPAEKLIKDLQEQIKWHGVAGDQVEIYRLRQQGATEADIRRAQALRDQLDALDAQAKALKAVEDMEREVNEFGMSGDQRKVEELKRSGASQDLIDRAQAAADEKKRLEDQKKAQDDLARDTQRQQDQIAQRARSLFDSTRTPLEKYNEAIRELNDLLAQGAISQEIFDRASRSAGSQLIGATAVAGAKNPAALERGSSAAFSAALRGRGETLQQQLLQQSRQQTPLLQAISRNTQPAPALTIP